MLRRIALFGLSCVACSHGADATPDASTFTGREGDLGVGSAVIDHGGPNGGFAAPLAHGPVTGAWQPAGCSGTVPVATGITDEAWGEAALGTTDPSPHAVHTSFRFDSASSFAVVWETDAATKASVVAYGDSPSKLDHFAQGVSFSTPTQPYDRLDYPLAAHEAHVCGLLPNHTYYFAVGGDGYWGKVYSVTTAPPAGADDAFRFVAMGDSNFFYDLYAQVQAAAGTYAPAFTLFTGDMVHDGLSQGDWEKWFTAGGPLLASVPTMTAHGNHEAMATSYFALFALPGEEEIYAFDYGNVHFVVLNDTPTTSADIEGRQATFLDQDLTAAEARPTPPRWIVTCHHRPMFSSDPDQGSFLNVRAAWQPILEKHHVDVDFNGHSHHYESTYSLVGDGGIVDGGGIRYITTGGAGALFDPPTPTPNAWSMVYYAGLSFAVIDVTAHTFTIQGKKVDGTALEAPIVLTK